MSKEPIKSKHVLAVRMLVAQTDWLDGPCRWAEGRIAWRGRQGPFVPEAADLARAQYCLTKIGQYPRASRIALGDPVAWLRERTGRLELAKRLHGLPTCALERLAQQAGKGDLEAVTPLALLLLAEALCVNTLPVAPSAALLGLGERAVPALKALWSDDGLPQPVRALAALIWGAIERTRPTPDIRRENTADDAGLCRCRDWGWRHGLPRQATLIAVLLSEPMGSDLASRYLAAYRADSPFQPSQETLRGWLAEGVNAETVVALAEAAAEAAPVARRVLHYRDGLPELKHRHERRRVAAFFREQRETALWELVTVFGDFAESTRDPAALRALTMVAQSLYDLAAATAWPTEAFGPAHESVLAVLQDGLTLKSAQQSAYLGLLAARRTTLWDQSGVTLGGKAGQESPRFRAWLQSCRQRSLVPLRTLFGLCGDRGTVERALDLGVAHELAIRKWVEPTLIPLALTLIEELGLERNVYPSWVIWTILETSQNAREARTTLQPILQAIQGKDLPQCHHFLATLLAATGHTRQGIHKRLPLLTPFLRSLVALVETDEDKACFCKTAIACALALVETAPEHAAARIAWLLAFLTDVRQRTLDWRQQASLEVGLTLAVALAAEDEAAFQAIVQTATMHRFRQDREQIEHSLSLLRRFPALRRPLAHLFPQQPQRCADLLVRLGRTTKLNTDVPMLLARLEPQRGPDATPGTTFPITLCPHADWWRLHRTAPELTPTANAYLHAQWLLGESPAVPAGVRRVLDTPQRLARELAHVETLGLAARVTKLRHRLADEETLTADIIRDAEERLTRLAALSQIAAAEQQVMACYRARLDDVAGPLPDGLELDDDLVNATLLTTDIGQNRRLLLRLLRSHMAGEHDWRERHPANEAFLAGLAAQGANTAAWLSEHPRRYPCPGAPGQTAHLRLERDPLHILQMGNHFETCLSIGGINAFSTVANACELNKRVVYARDGFGHVIGRQLIGLNADGDLIGFNIYTSLTEEADNDRLAAILRHYVIGFAARCDLRLSDTGTVPTLFAESWYDDGVMAWNEGRKPDRSASGTGYRRRAETPRRERRLPSPPVPGPKLPSR